MNGLAKILVWATGFSLAVRLAGAQATLPTAYTGPWQEATPPEGWTFNGLGLDYQPGYDPAGDGAAKLQNTGNAITVQFSQPAATVSYWLAGNSFSGGTFQVQQSSDGTNWTALQTYTALGGGSNFYAHTVAPEARQVRFYYELKATGNVGVDGISITKLAFVQPIIAGFEVMGEDARATVSTALAGRFYMLEHTDALATNPVTWTGDDEQPGADGALLLQGKSIHSAARMYRVRDSTP